MDDVKQGEYFRQRSTGFLFRVDEIGVYHVKLICVSIGTESIPSVILKSELPRKFKKQEYARIFTALGHP